MELKDFVSGYGILIKPRKEVSKKRSVKESLMFYYANSIIPFVLFALASLLLSSYVPQLALYYTWLHIPITGTFSTDAVLTGVLIFFIAVPLGIAVDAALYQLVGKKIMNSFKGNYSQTFSAATYAAMPFLAFGWLLSLPFIEFPIIYIIAAWELALFVIALGAQQKIMGSEAFFVFLMTLVLVVLVVFAVAAIVNAVQSYIMFSSLYGSALA